MDLNVRIAGEAGQGVVTVGQVLLGSLARMGFYVMSTQSYMSRIRGGLNWFDIRFGDGELFSRKEQADVLVALTEEAQQALAGGVAQDGLVLLDAEERPGAASIRFGEVAKELTGSAIMGNSVAAGAVFGALGYGVDALCDHVREVFKKDGAEVVEQNVACVRRGAELAAPLAGRIKAPSPAGAPASLCSGAQAIGLAAATAGVKFAAGYPMTPGTAVLTYLAQAAEKYGIVVEQAEDEIAAINMVCGATYAGVPALTATSGGGFALMVEGISLAAMLELPVVVVLAQRPGPATGMPTRTAQEDLKFVLSAGHGEFPRAVFAPGTQVQAYELTRRALEVAHKYQSPVILLVDQFLIDCVRNSPELDASPRPIDRHILEDPPEGYVRYALSPDGVSPRALPGGAAYVICDSDEHGEDGHLTEDFAARLRLQDKRMAKEAGLLRESLAPERYGPAQADRVLLAWGSTYLPCREAVDILNEDGARVAMVHFAQLWPIDPVRACAALGSGSSGEGPRVTSVEGNATGQLASLLREAGVLSDCDLMLRYDGLPFSAEEIVERFKQ